ncbi:hypothetical protein C8J56DRAFT_1061211 [Mycena floridula]|nr:hypothetical protein C8J56DRAFT_1061211 [Mycena floridula]
MPTLDPSASFQASYLMSRDFKTQVTPNETQRTTLIVAGVYCIVLPILWHVPILSWIIYPFKLLTVGSHEAFLCLVSHALVGVLTCARIHPIDSELDPDESNPLASTGNGYDLQLLQYLLDQLAHYIPTILFTSSRLGLRLNALVPVDPLDGELNVSAHRDEVHIISLSRHNRTTSLALFDSELAHAHDGFDSCNNLKTADSSDSYQFPSHLPCRPSHYACSPGQTSLSFPPW